MAEREGAGKPTKGNMTLIERQQPSHWYLRDGTPFHEIAKKDGTGNRAVTLADARKVFALPSVTNVLGVLAKPGLDAWKIEQGIMAALTLPRAADESLDVFAHRVVADMGEQVDKAADFGTAIHNACEVYAINKELPTDPKLLAHLRSWCDWFDANVERVACLETVFVHHEHGYAGRVDMVAKLRDIGWAVVDFKTQKIKRSAKGEPKPAFYETWPLQLAAYQQAILTSSAKDVSAIVSVVIDSAQPGPVHVKQWSTGQRSEDGGQKSADYYGAFLSAFELWRYVKQYDPRLQGSEPGTPLAA
jgi:hypothetical protein